MDTNKSENVPETELVSVSPTALLAHEDCFSFNGEEYELADINEVVQDACDYSEDFEDGKLVEMYAAESVHYKASEFFVLDTDAMGEAAYDVGGEYAIDWTFSHEQEKSLHSALKEAVDQWATENNLHPTFYTVRNVRKILVRRSSEDADVEIFLANAELSCEATKDQKGPNTDEG